MSSSKQPQGNAGKSESSGREWNPGDPTPAGAALPMDTKRQIPIQSLATFGSGTPQDPQGQELERFNTYARNLCKELGFTHIWIRAHVHNWATERDTVTKQKTGRMKQGEDPHITVYLGFKPDWIAIHGDVYVRGTRVKRGLLPDALMDPAAMKPQDGNPPRNLRLYIWENKTAPSAKFQEAMNSTNWRSK